MNNSTANSTANMTIAINEVLNNFNNENGTNMISVKDADTLNKFVTNSEIKLDKETKEKLLNTTSNFFFFFIFILKKYFHIFYHYNLFIII